MNVIKSLIGRRQFLIAAGVTSTCALTCKKFAGFIDRNSQTSAAIAAEKAAMAKLKNTANRCPHLLSPLRIRNRVLKNRIMHTQSPPHCLQGPENYPADAFRNHYSNMAKNAAIVSLEGHWGGYPMTYKDSSNIQSGTDHHSDSIWQDIPPVHNYVNRMIEDIHCEGALIAGGGVGGGGGPGGGAPDGGQGGMPGGEAGGGMPGGAEGGGMPGGPSGGGMPGGAEGGAPGGGQGGMPGGAEGGGMPGGPGGGMPGGGPQGSMSIEDIVAQAKESEAQGYDVISIDGSNSEAAQAIRSATNLILMTKLSVGGEGQRAAMEIAGNTKKWTYFGSELDWNYGSSAAGVSNVNQPTADEVEKAVEEARKLEGIVDILWIRDARHEHPNSFTQDREKPFTLAYAEAIKKAGIEIITCPSAGFHIATQNEEFIASGKTDMVGMTTPFFADPELIKKISEGRPEDIIPCLMCQDCHGISRTTGPWYDTCNVNPNHGLPIYKKLSVTPPTVNKKVAVIGGGPGGMKAAITAAERGHKVTLFEKSDALGGLLKFTDYTQWKWTYKDFKDYLVTQVKKAGIEVKLKTSATPSMIKSKGYDTVLVATGAEPIISKMTGADADNVFDILTAYSNKKALGKNIVVIGAGRIGTEAAIGMAKDGHKVTVLSSGKDLIELEFIGPHNMMNQIGILEGHPNFSCVLEATVKGITGGKVTYTDSEGNRKSIQADSIVIYAGLKPMQDEAEKFIGSAEQVLLLGDCTGTNGTIQKTIRSAFFMASQV